MPALIEHVALLVPNLEDAITRWSAVTGYTFSPIARYRTTHYVDSSADAEHLHDCRISLSKEGSPRIELMEATGEGTHSTAQLGVHHFGFRDVGELDDKLVELEKLGVPVDGVSRLDDGRVQLFFTDKAALDGVRFEYISDLPGPVVRDDGSALDIDPATGRGTIWGHPRS